MKNKSFILHLVLFFTLAFAACDKSTEEVLPDDQDTLVKYIPTANVYVAGYTQDSVTYVRQAAYWKNEVPVILTNGTKNAGANAIAVQGNDVYVAGYTIASNGNYIATYWKNGVKTDLTTSSTSAVAGQILIKGTDVYITGFVESSGVYWKNGQRIILELPPGSIIGSTSGIAMLDNDIYISGYQVTGSGPIAVYWKNGVSYTLPSTRAVYGNSIIAHQNNIYIGASYLSHSTTNEVNYWKNDLPVSLDGGGSLGAIVVDMAAKDNDIYVASLTKKGAGYFKNSQFYNYSQSDFQITGISVIDKDVYASGQTTYQQKSVPVFWKNDLPVYLSSPSGRSGFASAIVVTPL